MTSVDCLRLVALVILHLHTLNENILSSHQDSSVQYQFFDTHHPLYLILHILYNFLIYLNFTPSL
jgi:hypothetical protein